MATLPKDKIEQLKASMATAGFSTEEIDSIIGDQKDISADDLQNMISDFIKNNPEARQKFVKLQAAQKTASDVGQVLNAALGVGDLITSRNQIKQSNKALSRLSRPSLPTPPPRTAALEQALRMATRGGMDSASTIAPAQLANLDQYLKDINSAKTASTGQAGTFGALAQIAAQRRNQANAALAPVVGQAEAAQMGNFRDLLQSRQWEKINDFNNRMSIAQQDLRQYNREAEAAGALGQQGRINQRNSLANLANMVPGFVQNYLPNAQMPWENNIQAHPLQPEPLVSFGPGIEDYSNYINGSLQGTMRNALQNSMFEQRGILYN